MLRSFVSEQIGIMAPGNDVMSAIVSLFIEVFIYGILIFALILFLLCYIIDNLTQSVYSDRRAVLVNNSNYCLCTTINYNSLFRTQRRLYHREITRHDEPFINGFVIRLLLLVVFLFFLYVCFVVDCLVLDQMLSVLDVIKLDIKTMCLFNPNKGWSAYCSNNFNSLHIIMEARDKYYGYYFIGKYVIDAEHCGWCELSDLRINVCQLSIFNCVHECLLASDNLTKNLLSEGNSLLMAKPSNFHEEALCFVEHSLNSRIE